MMLSIAGLCLLHSVSGMFSGPITGEDFASAKERLMKSQSCFEQFVAQHVKELDDLYDGEPLLQHCVRENKADYCRILIEAGASKSKMYKPTWSAKDMNIVDLAEFYGSFECVQALRELGLKSAADTENITAEELAEAEAVLAHRAFLDACDDCDEKSGAFESSYRPVKPTSVFSDLERPSAGRQSTAAGLQRPSAARDESPQRTQQDDDFAMLLYTIEVAGMTGKRGDYRKAEVQFVKYYYSINGYEKEAVCALRSIWYEPCAVRRKPDLREATRKVRTYLEGVLERLVRVAEWDKNGEIIVKEY